MIREYIDSDLEELLDVWYKSTSIAHPFMDEAFLKKEEKNIRNIYIPNTKTWVYAYSKHLDGFISMIGNEVGAIFVRPEKHGQGIGKVLMDHVSQFHEELEVEVFKDNKIGRAFYDKYGFKIIKELLHEETKRGLLRMKFIGKTSMTK
jgi:putative acetyltransferase